MMFCFPSRFLAALVAVTALPCAAVDRDAAQGRDGSGRGSLEGGAVVGDFKSSPFGFGRARREEIRRAEAAGVASGSAEERDLKARAEAMSAKERKREAKRLARLAADRAAEGNAPRELTAVTPMAPPAPSVTGYPTERKRGGWFSGLGLGRARGQETAPEIFVHHELLPTLQPGNARIEIDLSDQRARVYRGSGSARTLVIDTPVSTGKAGYETPTGTFTIGEMQVEKRSTLYGMWLDGNGQVIPSSGDSSPRPPGGVSFVGAEMPYWMRITGGIGLHIGEVPGYPASHGCIRVPAEVQPLIYSKVALGTPVTIVH